MKRKRRVRGFTLLEVMYSLVVFVVALSGLVALQRVSAHGAMQGKRHTAAVNVASFFMTQIQIEFSSWWSQQGISGVLTGTQYPLISNVLNGGAGIRAWQTLDTPGDFRIEEYLGHSDLDPAVDNDPVSRFCVNYMLIPVQEGECNPATGLRPQNGCEIHLDYISIWRIHVRVSWTRDGELDVEPDWKDCTPASVDARLADPLNTDEVIEIVGSATRELAQ
ncbi:MAG: prepilin-type N-terminal cleavage/methylation domain-containing protein [Deltaproteobacteria bacterium]|nr:prepilin-type N-terminal cleavage/methylation domain-containing protein [Deltaproteobacteria bacterium]